MGSTLLKAMLDIQHRFNPLHVYCRLVERGVKKELSISICKYYSILIYSWLTCLTVVGVQICKLIKRATWILPCSRTGLIWLHMWGLGGSPVKGGPMFNFQRTKAETSRPTKCWRISIRCSLTAIKSKPSVKMFWKHFFFFFSYKSSNFNNLSTPCWLFLTLTP